MHGQKETAEMGLEQGQEQVKETGKGKAQKEEGRTQQLVERREIGLWHGSKRRDLNTRPIAPKAIALPSCATFGGGG